MQLYYPGAGWCRTHDDCSPDEKYVYCSEAQVLITMNESILSPAQTLPLMEAFYTIQGEGYHQGKAAYFLRLGGCDVGCVWCDVKESWDASAHPLVSVSAMVSAAKKFPGRIAVVT